MKRLIILMTLLAMLVGSPLPSKGAVYTSSSGNDPQLEEVQVTRRDSAENLSEHTHKGLNYDSLARAVLFIAGPTIIPEISNYNKVNFIYEDSVLTDNVMLVTGEISKGFANSIDLMAIKISKEIGLRVDLFLKTLARKSIVEAKAYLRWPTFVVLSLALLLFSTVTERRLLQYITGALFVASIVGSIIYLPDILVPLSEHGYNVYDLLTSGR